MAAVVPRPEAKKLDARGALRRAWLSLSLALPAAVFLIAWSHPVAPAQATGAVCVGDCSRSGEVTIADLLTLVNVALGAAPIAACATADINADGQITIGELLAAVNNALNGCPTPVQLSAAVHFERPAEPINEQLIGTGPGSPLAQTNTVLRTLLSPPRMRLDVGFEDSGCPDNPNSGALYNAEDNSFNYCQLDERLSQAQAVGATPLLIIDYTPPVLAGAACTASNGNALGVERCPPADSAKYGALVEAMIRHVYTAFGVTDFEVWNEPDGTFFAGTFADYLTLYQTCNAAVGRAEGALGLPSGTLHLGGPAAFVADNSWINRLLAAAVRDPTLRLDFISWHNYANNPFGEQPDPTLYAGTYGDDTEKVRGLVTPYQQQRPDLHPLLWIDEWNVNAFFDWRMDTAYGATFLVAALHGMQDAGLDRSARFNTWDSTPATPVGFNGNWGFFTYDGAVRPALFAFALWRQMTPTRAAVELLDSASLARDASRRTRYAQNLIAAIDPGPETATVLVYNFTPYSPLDAEPPYCGNGPTLDAALDLTGLTDGEYQLAQQQIDCTLPIQPADRAALPKVLSNLTVASQRATLTITVPPDGTVLLTLTRAR